MLYLCRMEFFYSEKNGWNKWLKSIASKKYSSCFVLVDQNTAKHCLPYFKKQVDFPFTLITVAGGEASKNLKTCTVIWEALLKGGADRHSLLIILGGGVLTDMGAFAAATFQRGIQFTVVPTSLMAMTDAAIGGKTGVNFGPIKNQIGTFTQAESLLLDTRFLNTLPLLELHSGFAELLKHGILKGGTYWKQLASLSTPTIPYLEKLLPVSISYKQHIVDADAKESGLRKVLNFGHTIGHAIESLHLAKRKPITHGAAVLQGMWVEIVLSVAHAGLKPEIANQLFEVLERFTKIPTYTEKEISLLLSYLQHDKKNNSGNCQFVLLEAIGKPVFNQVVALDHIAHALRIC